MTVQPVAPVVVSYGVRAFCLLVQIVPYQTFVGSAPEMSERIHSENAEGIVYRLEQAESFISVGIFFENFYGIGCADEEFPGRSGPYVFDIGGAVDRDLQEVVFSRVAAYSVYCSAPESSTRVHSQGFDLIVGQASRVVRIDPVVEIVAVVSVDPSVSRYPYAARCVLDEGIDTVVGYDGRDLREVLKIGRNFRSFHRRK